MTTSVEIQSNQNNSVSSESQSQQVVQDSSQRKENPNASTNPTRTETFEWLQAHNYPPLPVAPAQDPHKYPKTNKKGEIEWSKEKDVPVPRFTGKNPSYLDKNGIPHTVNHHHYQNEHPTQKDLDLWFANDLNGIGTLGGWNNTVWLDFDVKQFESSAKCEKAAVECVGQIRTLTNQMPFLEQTHSGGWRIGVRVKTKPNFTNFALTPGGHHVGEALGKGRFTVLAPTIGPSGNPYTSINRVPLPEIESLEQIGIYPKSLAVEKKRVRESLPLTLPLGNGIRLEDLGNEPSRQVLRGDDIKGDRSDSLTGAIKEWFGWDNWCDRNNIHPVGTPENLAHQSALGLGIDEDRVGRILKTIDIPSCQPAAYHKGGDESCWKKIWKLDRPSFEANCPEVIKERIKSEFAKEKVLAGVGAEANGSGNTQEGKGKTNVVEFPTAPMQFGELRKQIRLLLEKNSSDSDIAVSKISLRADYGRMSEREFNDLWDKEEEALVKEIEQEETRKEIEEILSLTEQKLKLKDFLPESLAEPLENWSKSLSTEEAVSLFTVLTAVSSLHKVGTELVVLSKTNFRIPPTMFAALVAESGQRKSPIFRTLIAQPLTAIENSKKAAHEQAMREYRKAVAAYNKTDKTGEPPKEPVNDLYYFTEGTSEGIKNLVAKCPDKTQFALVDELAGFFNSQNKYRGGKGGDKQELLSYFDGSGAKVLRAGGVPVNIERIYLSIFGTIQPEVLENLMKSGDADGFWSRFLFVKQPNVAATLGEDGLVDIVDLMTGLYKRIDRYPKMEYRLTREAFKKYKVFYDALEETRIISPQEMRAIFPKIISYVGRLAQNLHVLIHAAKNHDKYESVDGLPPTEISGSTMEAAIKLAKHQLGQAKLSNIHSTPYLDKTSDLGKLITESKRQRASTSEGWLKAKTFANCFSSKKRPKADYCRSLFLEAKTLGFGETRGAGIRLEFRAYSEEELASSTTAPILQKAAETFSSEWDSPQSSQDCGCCGAVDQLEPGMEPPKALSPLALDIIAANEANSGEGVVGSTTEIVFTPNPASIYHAPVEIPIDFEITHPEDYPEPPPIDENPPIEKGALCRFIGVLEAAKVLAGYAQITELQEEEDYVVEEVIGDFIRLRKPTGELFWEDGEPSELSDYYRHEIFFQIAKLNANKAYRYTGEQHNIQKLCQQKPLYVVGFNQEGEAIVESPEWATGVRNAVPVAELALMPVKNE
jgi:uncharacterized protein YdcH (DUF465 family)